MAKQVGPLKIAGTFDDICFYHDKEYGYLVRMKGGPTRKQFKTSPTFQRSRENSDEFKQCSPLAAQIRQLVIRRTHMKDNKLYHRLMTLMNLLTKEDKISARGERKALKGMQTAEGKRLVSEFKLEGGFSLLEILGDAGMIEKETLISKDCKSFISFDSAGSPLRFALPLEGTKILRRVDQDYKSFISFCSAGSPLRFALPFEGQRSCGAWGAWTDVSFVLAQAYRIVPPS